MVGLGQQKLTPTGPLGKLWPGLGNHSSLQGVSLACQATEHTASLGVKFTMQAKSVVGVLHVCTWGFWD